MPKDTNDSRVMALILKAIDDINETLEEEDKIPKSSDMALFGPSGVLDSLGFVNLIVAVEQKIEEEFGISLTLADERAMSRQNSPFRTIGTLADHVAYLLKEKK